MSVGRFILVFLVATAILVLASRCAQADHFVFAVTYCMENRSIQVKKVELFETETGDRLRWWTKETYEDENIGMEAYMKRDRPDTWKSHHIKMYKSLVRECGFQS